MQAILNQSVCYVVNSAQLVKFLSGSLSGLHVGTYRQGK